jgi:hypothetical protein
MRSAIESSWFAIFTRLLDKLDENIVDGGLAQSYAYSLIKLDHQLYYVQPLYLTVGTYYQTFQAPTKIPSKNPSITNDDKAETRYHQCQSKQTIQKTT